LSNKFHDLVRALRAEQVRFVLIGVAGANYYAAAASVLFATKDRDLFLPLDPDNLVRAWHACESLGLELTSSGEPLDRPRDRWLAGQMVDRSALTRAHDGRGLEVDLTLLMAGFEFEEVWRSRHDFSVDGAELPVAQLAQIVKSKAAAGRPKDRLFLETHKEALRELLPREEPPQRSE